MLSRSEALFIVHGSHPIDILLLAFGAYAIPAGVLILCELLAAGAGRAAVQTVHRVAVSILVALILLPIVKRIAPVPGAAAVAIALGAGTALALLYLRGRTWAWSVVYLSPALLLFPGMLLFHSPISTIVLPGRAPAAVKARVGNPAPVVMLVLDEFPLASLLDRDGKIDATLYPNFAELSQRGTWYRNATAAGESTLISVPAILDGKYPNPDKPALPDAAGHPNTLFTLLGGSYRMNVTENNTRLCPAPLCSGSDSPIGRRLPPLFRDAAVLWLYTALPSDLTGPLPDISESWANFTAPPKEPVTLAMWGQFDESTDWQDRVQQFRNFTNSIGPSRLPTLHFLHILLPHAPWEYLPSGQRCTVPESRIRGLRGPNDRGEDANRWTNDRWAVVQSYQRHLLQVGLVDRLVGTLVKRLRDTGLYDSALLVITADHGTSFRPGDSRRSVTPTNHADLMAVPLFIKYPHQTEGVIDDRDAEGIDILPTVAQVLKAKPAAQVDGHSLLAKDPPVRRNRIVVTDAGRKLAFRSGLDDLFATVKYKLSIFGGESGNGALYRVDDRYGWVGRDVTALAPAAAPGLKDQLDLEAYYSKVDLHAPTLVTNITGRVIRSTRTDEGGDPLKLAVAVNGTIRTVTETYRAGNADVFSAMVPETALRSGRNNIATFLIRDDGTLARLDRVSAHPYQWGTRLTFGRGGNAGPYYGTGWSVPEDQRTWTDGHRATLYLPVTTPQANVTLKGALAAFTYRGRLDRQHVRLLVNRHPVKNWVLIDDFEECIATVPKEYFAGQDTAEIAFEMPDAVAPISLRINNNDSRTLGLGAMWLELTPTQDPANAARR